MDIKLPSQRTEDLEVDDILLVRRCRQGNSFATGQLIEKYQDRIYNLILKICRNSDDAMELTQDTFVKFIENIDSFKEKSSFYTWLFRIALNLVLNHCKRRFRLNVTSLDGSVDESFGRAKVQLKSFLSDNSVEDPAVIAQDREVVMIVMESLSQLDDEHRVVVVLRDIEGCSYDEIAEILQLELGTVKSRLSRARERLRNILKDVYDE